MTDLKELLASGEVGAAIHSWLADDPAREKAIQTHIQNFVRDHGAGQWIHQENHPATYPRNPGRYHAYLFSAQNNRGLKFIFYTDTYSNSRPRFMEVNAFNFDPSTCAYIPECLCGTPEYEDMDCPRCEYGDEWCTSHLHYH